MNAVAFTVPGEPQGKAVPTIERLRAQIQVDGKKRWLGEFLTSQEAHAAYVAAKRVLHPHGTL